MGPNELAPVPPSHSGSAELSVHDFDFLRPAGLGRTTSSSPGKRCTRRQPRRHLDPAQRWALESRRGARTSARSRPIPPRRLQSADHDRARLGTRPSASFPPMPTRPEHDGYRRIINALRSCPRRSRSLDATNPPSGGELRRRGSQRTAVRISYEDFRPQSCRSSAFLTVVDLPLSEPERMLVTLADAVSLHGTDAAGAAAAQQENARHMIRRHRGAARRHSRRGCPQQGRPMVRIDDRSAQ
jgi:hypothetical protein